VPSFCGRFALVLHAHLPYVLSHGIWPHGTDWLHEAAAGTYIPLLNTLNGLVKRGVSPKVTVDVTPVLAEQLANDEFTHTFAGYLDQKISAAERDVEEFEKAGRTEAASLARLWYEHFLDLRADFIQRYGKDLIGEWRRLQDEGHIEIITSAATHGYLPLLANDAAVRAQIAQGVEAYRRHFGRNPRGMWLPECAYRPRYEWTSPITEAGPAAPVMRQGLEEILAGFGIEYFIVDSHMLRGGNPVGAYLDRFDALRKLWDNFAAHYAPRPLLENTSIHTCYRVGLAESADLACAVFARDPETGYQVWSGEWGYPGDPHYLEFHKKHFPGGHRYWRVSGPHVDLDRKEHYDPAAVTARLEENSTHFVQLIRQTLEADEIVPPSRRVLCAPFDAELFGHWWFEGPKWLERVLLRVAEQKEIKLATCGESLDACEPKDFIQLPEGCWGEGGFHWIWLNSQTEWTWRCVYEAEERMVRFTTLLRARRSAPLERVVKQAARELLLLESSDWQFLISTQGAPDYAERRVKTHFESFTRLAEMVEQMAAGEHSLRTEDREYLELCEARDGLFPSVDVMWWADNRL